MILGTAAYMSPEQARGKPVDKRADIWAFGVVLYEMLTGRQAFHGETITDVLAAVVKTEPEWTALPGATPATIARLIQRCVNKDPRRRMQAIGDARIAIEDVLAGTVEEPLERLVYPGARRWGVFASVAAGIVVLAAALGFTLAELRNGRTRSIEPVNLSIALPQGQSVSVQQTAALAISSDGRRVVYRGSGTNGQQLYLRDLDSFRTTRIPDTQGAESPFFSPDGQWVAFTAQGKLKKVALTGGGAQVICDSIGAYNGGTWDSDGNIYFARASNDGIFRVSAAGGPPQVITRVKVETKEGDNWPQVLPGGKSAAHDHVERKQP